ncbi:MAG: hypothetical protein IJ758_01715 [Clostridia bacterium]|nr:hypothetical protein [Clostridia bacterium]
MKEEKISKRILFISCAVTILFFVLVFGLLLVDKNNHSYLSGYTDLLSICNKPNEKYISFKFFARDYRLDLSAGYNAINNISSKVYELYECIKNLIKENIF